MLPSVTLVVTLRKFNEINAVTLVTLLFIERYIEIIGIGYRGIGNT